MMDILGPRFNKPGEKEAERVNRIQQDLFDRTVHLFDRPFPDGVEDRLKQIVATASIQPDDLVLDVGSGTGILIPHIQEYQPGGIYACDLSPKMVAQLKKNHPVVETFLSDVRDLTLPDGLLTVIFINASYSNIVDKVGSFQNLARMMKPGGRMVISHPLGKGFIRTIKAKVPFPLDDFPDETAATTLLKPFGFHVSQLLDEPNLYILTATREGHL